MSRVKGGFKTRRRRKRLLKLAKGFEGGRRKLFTAAKATVDRSLAYAYVGRKHKKRNFRSLWIVRINAAARENGLSYSRFMEGLNKAGIELDRKTLAAIALEEPSNFASLVETAKSNISLN